MFASDSLRPPLKPRSRSAVLAFCAVHILQPSSSINCPATSLALYPTPPRKLALQGALPLVTAFQDIEPLPPSSHRPPPSTHPAISAIQTQCPDLTCFRSPRTTREVSPLLPNHSIVRRVRRVRCATTHRFGTGRRIALRHVTGRRCPAVQMKLRRTSQPRLEPFPAPP